MKVKGQIKEIFNNYAEKKNFSGAGIVKLGNDVLFHDAYGYAHKGWKIDNKINTKFDTASITKIFTAVSILQLVDKKLISLDDRVLDIIDIGETQIPKEVTIYHCLTHTSGIADDADEEAGEDYEEIWKDKPNYSVRETVDYLPQFVHKEPNFKPGEGCRYNNCAFILLGLVIEKVTGQKYHDYVKENIFDAIGMKDTGFYSMDEIKENTAECYAEILDEDENLIGWRKNIYSYPSIGAPDAGALTTVGDLDLFLRSIKDGKLLSKELTEEMFKPKELYRKHTNVTHMMGFGLEFYIRNENNEILYIQKDGINAGVACVMSYYPSIDGTIVVMANQDCNVWDLAWDVQELLIGEI